VVRLVHTDTEETARWFYVQCRTTVTVDGIEPGTYRLFVSASSGQRINTDYSKLS